MCCVLITGRLEESIPACMMSSSITPAKLALLALVLPYWSGTVLGQEQHRHLRPNGISIDIPGVGGINIGSDGISTTSSTDNSTTSDPTDTDTSPINYSDYVRKHNINTDDGTNAVCRMQREMDEDGTICVAGASWLAVTKLFPPQIGSGLRVVEPKDVDSNLPQALKDLRPLPATVDVSTIEVERPTYYWYFRLIMNLYSEMSHAWPSRSSKPIDVGMPDGWEHPRFYNVSIGDDGDAPLAVSYVRDGKMVLVLRGTIFSEEWVRDFDYRWAANSTEFAGNVHAGFYQVFLEMVDDVMDEVNARAPTSVTVSGHSLGGAVANLLGYYITTSTKSSVPVTVISFGAPQVGDADFVADFNRRVNNRHVAFKGTGSKRGSYVVGDVLSQVPCGKIRTCPLLNDVSSMISDTSRKSSRKSTTTSDRGESYTYAAVGGDVGFVYSDLKNADVWKDKNDLNSFFYAPIASHICSYACFLAPSVGDRDDKCFFPLDWEPDVLIRNRCNTLM